VCVAMTWKKSPTVICTFVDFSKENLDPEYVAQREALVTRGWHRLKELKALGEVSILEFPLPEVIETLQQKKS